MKLYQEFKKFINRGNILDLSVAVVLGAAFGKIINSLVKDIVTPVLSLVLGDEGFSNYKYVITPANTDLGIQENAIYYGIFFQNIIDFLIIALVIFFFVRTVNKARELSKEMVEETKDKTNDLLKDIKVLLSETVTPNDK